MFSDVGFDTAAGAASPAHALLAATVAALRPAALDAAKTLDATGGVLMAGLDPCALRPDALSRTLSRLDAPGSTPNFGRDVVDDADAFPAPIRAALRASPRALRWRTIMPGMQTFDLEAVSDGAANAQLIKLRRGRIIPRHAHEGEELTLVLRGSFSDERGVYAKGDLCAESQGDEHEPRVSAEADCLCLSVTTGRLRVTRPIAGVVRYLLS